jgi:DNA polymerase-3 subunit alpha
MNLDRAKSGDHDIARTKLGKRGDHDVQGTKYGARHHHGLVIQRTRATGNLKPMRFVSLHHHSTFSYLDGYQLPEAHVRRAAELNMSAMAITEHGNIDSHVKFETAADKMGGVKPIFGCEVYMPTSSVDKDGKSTPWYHPYAETQMKHHLTIIAKDQEGYRNLLALVTESWQHFYYDPIVTWPQLVKHKRGLIVLSGCSGSLLFCSTVGGKNIDPKDASYKRGLSIARMFKREFGDNYFIEVQAFPKLENTRRFNKLAPRIARAIGARLVGTKDCHYTLLEEAEVQKILHNLRPGNKQTIEEQARSWGYDLADLCPPPNDNTIYRQLRGTGLSKEEAIEAIVSTEEIAQSCTATLPKLPMIRFPVPAGYPDAMAYWRERLREGWRERGLNRLPPARRAEYKKQLQTEMELIEGKDFIDYFLLVAAGVKYIKDQGNPCGACPW